jgi:hypothetical protein
MTTGSIPKLSSDTWTAVDFLLGDKDLKDTSRQIGVLTAACAGTITTTQPVVVPTARDL